jgi:hypothetical protein
LRQLPVTILIGPVALDEVLEAKGTSKANIAGRGIGCRDLEKLERKARFLFFLLQGKLG